MIRKGKLSRSLKDFQLSQLINNERGILEAFEGGWQLPHAFASHTAPHICYMYIYLCYRSHCTWNEIRTLSSALYIRTPMQLHATLNIPKGHESSHDLYWYPVLNPERCAATALESSMPLWEYRTDIHALPLHSYSSSQIDGVNVYMLFPDLILGRTCMKSTPMDIIIHERSSLR